MERRAVVVGGAGFVGSHVCERLLTDGYDVVCIDNFVTGSPENIARIFNTLGPRMKFNDGRAIPAFIHQALRGEPITVATQELQWTPRISVEDGLENTIAWFVKAGASGSAPACPLYDAGLTAVDDARVRNR